MASPFPGMDPYLEGSQWMSFHAQLVAEFARQLAPLIRPRYFARMEKRLVADDPFGVTDEASVELMGESRSADTHPDIGVIEGLPKAANGERMASVALAPAPLELSTVIPQTAPQHSVEIQDIAGRRLVTAIELLSPSNKRGTGYNEYVKRRTRFLQSPAHLVEVDLLRTGHRVPMRKPLPAAPYFAFVGRVGRRPITEVWPIALEQSLPDIPIPLLRGDPPVALSLQRASSNVYEQLSYDLSLRYERPPEIALDADAGRWATALLRARDA